jgi:NLR family CARD domain-containing protein 3
MRAHPELAVLDISHAFATEDFGARYNWLTEELVDPACGLIATASKLRYVDLGYTQITQHRLNQILEMIERSTEHGLLYFGARAAVV